MPDLVVASSSLSPVPRDPTAALQAALTNFENALTTEQKQQFHVQVQQFNQQKPDASSVIRFVAQIDAINHGKTRTSVSNRLCTFLDATRQFTDIVNTFVSSNPVIAALVWGGVKTTILVASNVASYFDRVASMIMAIGQICPIYREFAHLYSDSTALQQALCEYYAIVIRLVTKVVLVSQRTVVNSIISSVVSPFESDFKPFQDELAEASRVVKLQVSLAAKQAAHASARLVELESESNKQRWRFARGLASDIKAEHDAAQQIRLQESARRAAKMRLYIKDQLSTINSQVPWKQAQRQRLTGTAEWFRDEPVFQAWQADPHTATLWCSGRMGTGKTVTMSSIIAHLHLSLRAGDMIAFHFCRAENSASLSARNILGTLARQILDKHIADAHDHQLQSLRDTCQDLNTVDIVNLLLSYLGGDKKYYIIIDGLDECDHDQILELTENMANLCAPKDRSIKVIYSGRPELEHQLFQGTKAKYRLFLSKAMVNADIERYIDAELDKCLEQRKFKLVNPEAIWRIRDTLFAEHDGLILFIRLFIEEICMLGNENAILRALDNPPRKVSDLLTKRLHRVQNHDLAMDAMKMLRYCGCTKRPLTVNEFSELLSLSLSQTSLDRASIPQNMDQIITACCGLVYVEEEEVTVHYVHHSVKHHLFANSATQLPGFIERETDIHLGCLCLTYLDFNDFKRQLRKVNATSSASVAPIDIGLVSIQNYSSTINDIARKLLKARRSPQQLTTAELSRRTEDILGEAESSRLRAEVQSRPFYLLDYVQSYWIWHSSRFDKDCKMWNRFLACVDGKNDLARRPWIPDDSLQDAGKEKPVSPAKWALSHDHDALLLYSFLRESPYVLLADQVEDVLECVVQTNKQHLVLAIISHNRLDVHIAQSCLYHAAGHGREKLLEVCIEAGADPNVTSQDGLECSALHIAALGGYLSVVERLLAANADVNMTDRKGMTALHFAAAGGDHAIIECLLALNTNIDTTDGNGRTALHIAASGGHLSVVECLLAANADVNMTNQYGRTALHSAAVGGHVEVVDRLLAANADVNMANQDGRTALHVAAARGKLVIMERLLAANININMTDRGGKTALHIAAAGGYLEGVRRLLAVGAEIDMVDRSGRSALRQAADKGHLEVVQWLRHLGAR